MPAITSTSNLYNGFNRQSILTPAHITPKKDLLEIRFVPRMTNIGDAVKFSGDFLLFHLFRDSRKSQRGEPFSNYDPATEKIAPSNGGYFDLNNGSPVEVKRVLLLGSNHEIWKRSLNCLPPDQILTTPLNSPEGVQKAGLKDAQIVASASVLHAGVVLKKHSISFTILYLPSDLPPSSVNVPNIESIRNTYVTEKVIDETTSGLLAAYGFSGLPIISNKDLWSTSNPDRGANRNKVASGQGIWHALESQFRAKAGQMLRKIVKSMSVEPIAEEHFPGGLEEWRAQVRDKNETWAVRLEDGHYYVDVTRKGMTTQPILIGTKGLDSNKTAVPTCPMISCTLAIRANELGFDSVLGAFDSETTGVPEIVKVSGGFFIARRLLGVSTHPFALEIDANSLIGMSCGRDGKHAFRRNGVFYSDETPTSTN